MQSKEKNINWTPFSSIQSFYQSERETPKPIINKGEGIYLWDTNGKKYIDASSGPVATNLGHRNQKIIKASHEQMQKVAYASRFFFDNEANIKLASLISSAAGPGFERVFFVSGGSEATETAIKLARQYAVKIGQSSRWKVISRNPSYHGATLGAVAVSGDFSSENLFGAMTATMPKISAPFSYRVPTSHTVESYALACAQELEDKIIAEGPDTILAFIVEPIGGLATGALISPETYYQRIREICTKYGVLLIHDEVMSGVCRNGLFLTSHHWKNTTPDIVTLAKGLAAGYNPLGAVLTSKKLVDTLVSSGGGFMHGFTYSANPLSCAIGYAAVKETLDNNLGQNAQDRGKELTSALKELQKKHRLIGDVRGKGLLMAIEIVQDPDTKTSFPAEVNAISQLVKLAMNEGLLLYSRRTAEGKYGEWLMLAPPLITTSEQIKEIVYLLDKTLTLFDKKLNTFQ